MSISTALSNALSGLTVSSRSAELISDNVANALTPGYTRKTLDVSSRSTLGMGQGAEVTAINASQSPILTAELRRVQASLGEANTGAEALDRLSRAIGEPESATALAARAINLETALSAAANDPSSVQNQNNLLNAANRLADTFNQISTENRRIRMDADAEIAKQVGEVNDTLKDIEALNREIKLRELSGSDTTALLDQRKALVDRLSSIIPVRTNARPDGDMAIFSQNGATLLSDTASTLEFTQTGVIVTGMSLANGNLSGITLNGTTVDMASSSGKGPLDGGTLSALFDIRDNIVPSYETQLDALAQDLIGRFQDVTVDTTLVAGDAGLFTDNGIAFTAGNEIGLAGRIQVNSAVDPSQGGELWRLRDGINAIAPGSVGNATLLQNGLDAFGRLDPPTTGLGMVQNQAFSGFAFELTSERANAAELGEERAVNLTVQRNSLREAEAAAIGVDTDRELQELLLVEQAYSANVRVITVADEMLQRLLEI